MKNFAIIGVSGYISPRHLQAIKNTNNKLIASLDKFDSVGIIDRFFPNSDFFTEFERFDRHIYKLRNDKNIFIDYITICTPNYLHDSHIRFALNHQSDAICEKPLVLNPWNVDSLLKLEKDSENNIYNILQLRLHPSVINLKKTIDLESKEKIYDIDLTYLTSRGNWYYTSWKGDAEKSGGLATNIGIHFFDMLIYIFGDVEKNIVHVHTHDRASGFLLLKNARVRWFLSINSETIPKKIADQGKKTFRSLTIEGKEFEFSGGFDDLHTESYKKILNKEGFRIEDSFKAIKLVHDIRHISPLGLVGDYHPFAKLPISKHPFKH